MDFFAHQEQARRKTGLLVVYFVAAIVGIVAAIYVVLSLALGQFTPQAVQSFDPRATQGAVNFPLLGAVSIGTLAVVLLGSLYKISQLSSGGRVVAEALGGRLVSPGSADPSERRLLNVVEEMAIASGTPVPPVYVMDQEQAINAFAAGFSPSDAVVVVTRGTLEQLSRDELQGVIGHEFSHILNGDMRLNIRLIGLLHGILVISLVGWMLFRATSSRRVYFASNSKKGGNPLPLIGLAIYIIGYVGLFFGKLIKSAVSRQREFLADASSVQFTRNPGGMADALRKVGGLPMQGTLENAQAEEASHMFFANALGTWAGGLLSTHPPLAERIRRIEATPLSAESAGNAPVATTPDATRAVVAPSVTEGLSHLSGEGPRVPFGAPQVPPHVGAPHPPQIEYAASLVSSLPAELTNLVHEPYSARAVVFALLLSRDPRVRTQQLELLGNIPERDATARVWPLIERLGPALRLPLAEMTLPALQYLSPEQYQQFIHILEQLVAADQWLSLFEYALRRMLTRHLAPRFEGRRAPAVRFRDVAAVRQPIGDLLSVLAHAGHDNVQQAAAAYARAARACFGSESGTPALRNRDGSLLQVLDAALKQLEQASPSVKRSLLAGCAEAVGTDGLITVSEGELLRIVSDALDCPMPPIHLEPVR